MDLLLFGMGMAFAVAALLALLSARYHQGQVRVLTRPTSPIAAARPGQVKLAGRLVADQSLVSPVSEKKCVYMHITMRPLTPKVTFRHRRGGFGRHHSQASIDHSYDLDIERKVERAWLEDDSGRIRVDLEGADFSLAVDKSVRSSLLGPGDPESERILRRFGARTASGRSRGSFRIREAILEPGDTVLVTGKLFADGTGVFAVGGDSDHPLSITDRSATESTRRARSSARLSWVAAAACLLVAGCLLVLSFLAGPQKPAPRSMPRPEQVDPGGNW